MGPEWVAAFQNFGYPALVSGVLLYIVVNKLEKVTAKLEEIQRSLDALTLSVAEYRADVRDKGERRSG